MWEYITANLPLVIILIIAIIVCGADLIKAIAVWKAKDKERVDKKVDKQQKENNLTAMLQGFQESLSKIDKKLDDQDARFEKIETKLNDLTESDKNDIKGWIVEQYHRFYIDQGWIDAFSADTIDRRYNDYKKEGGNSYISTLMDRLHTLPMDPQIDSEERE